MCVCMYDGGSCVFFFVKNCVEENFLFAHNQKNPEFISRAMYWFSLNFQRHNNFIVCVCLYVCVYGLCVYEEPRDVEALLIVFIFLGLQKLLIQENQP